VRCRRLRPEADSARASSLLFSVKSLPRKRSGPESHLRFREISLQSVMNISKIVVPTAFPDPPAPHFDDEATIVSARQVVPLDKARDKGRIVERSRLALWICLVLFGAAAFGALGALGVNYYENHQRTSAALAPQSKTSQQPQSNEPASQTQSDVTLGKKSEPPEGGVTSAVPVSSESESSPTQNQNLTQTNDSSAMVPSRESDSESTLRKPANPAIDPGRLVRKRRVSPVSQNDGTVPPEKPAKNKRGAGRIQEIFAGPNPK
jgi:hypothetical protein